MRPLLVAYAALVLVACAPRVTFVSSGAPFVRRPNVAPEEVVVLHAADPLPAFTELGYLEANQEVSMGPATSDGFVRRLAEQAAARGCNAIVLHDGCVRTAWSRHGRYQFARFAATCVWIDRS